MAIFLFVGSSDYNLEGDSVTTQINNFVSLVPNLERQVPQLEELSAVDVRGAGEGVVDDGARGRSSTDNGSNYISAAVGCQTSLWKFTAAKVQGSVSSHVYMGCVL